MNGPLCSAISGCNKTAHGKKPEENITIKDVYSFFKFSIPPTFMLAKESYWWLFLILTRTLFFFLTFLPLFNTDINWVFFCLVPVRRFPSTSRSIRFGDVSQANGRKTPHIFAWTTSPETLWPRGKMRLGTRQSIFEDFSEQTVLARASVS